MPPTFVSSSPRSNSDDDVSSEVQPRKDTAKENVQKKLPTLDELRECIPKECFEKSLPKSLAYLVWDFALLAALYYFVGYFEFFGYIGLAFWYFVMGMIGFSLFVVGHDCGHGSFSNYKLVNDIVGHIAHAPIFAPYFPWQKSHRQHHTYTSHLTKDKGHPWITEKTFKTWNIGQKVYAHNPLSSLIRWNFYTILGVTDGSHFNPFGSMFSTKRERIECAISGAACLFSAAVALHICHYDAFTYLKYYITPVLAQGFWLTMVTYLQHKTDDITVYEDGTWGYVKGQLQTVDRPYGFGIDQLMHHITDGHVAHHLFFTAIPHYNLMKATKAIEAKLAPYGVYKKKVSYDFLYEFCRLNFKLEYLIGSGTGILNFYQKEKN